ncbi:DHA2 family efflux MFS transporter permease subunit [Oleispirillum naphthae]|uniref:DHA2 family efflux MFS transporter permease subunit n=1 Tax=Oleispirillum naphthae TaxID=2838853 RepID=UPI0030824428
MAAPREKIPPRLLIGFLAMVLGMFMAILDIQIVAASLAEIQAGLAASADEIVWVQNAYLIAEVIMIPLSGYLSRALGTRWSFVISAAGFTLASMGCAMAQNMNQMIVLRVIQGFIGGAMIPSVFAAAYTVMPRSRQASVTVMIGLVATIAPTIGPTLGGWLTETFSWHWLFLANVVPGIVVTLTVAAFMDVDKPQLELIRRLDVLGLVLMAAFLGCLDFVLEDGARNDWFADDAILVCAVVSALAGVGFFWRTLTADNPIVDLRAFSDRNFASGCVFSFVLGIALYGLVYLQPQFLGRVRGLNAMQIGGVMLVTGLSQFLSAPVVGNLSRRVDPRVLLCCGFSLLAASNWLVSSGITADWDFDQFVVPQILRGMGFMFTIIPANVLALGTLPPERLKNASGLYNLMRNLGGAFGLAGITTMLDQRGALHWARIGEHISPSRVAVQEAMSGLTQHFAARDPGIDATAAAAKTIARMVQKQATVITFGDVFFTMSMISLAAVGIVLLARKPKQAAAAGH